MMTILIVTQILTAGACVYLYLRQLKVERILTCHVNNARDQILSAIKKTLLVAAGVSILTALFNFAKNEKENPPSA